MMATNYFYLPQELTLQVYRLASPAWPTHCLWRPGVKFGLPLACWVTSGNLPTFSVLQVSLWKQLDEGLHFDSLMGELNEVTLEKCEGHTYIRFCQPLSSENSFPLTSTGTPGFPPISLVPPLQSRCRLRLPYKSLRSWCALGFSLKASLFSLVRGDFVTEFSPRPQVPAVA